MKQAKQKLLRECLFYRRYSGGNRFAEAIVPPVRDSVSQHVAILYQDKGQFVRKKPSCSWCNGVTVCLCLWFSVRLSLCRLSIFSLYFSGSAQVLHLGASVVKLGLGQDQVSLALGQDQDQSSVSVSLALGQLNVRATVRAKVRIRLQVYLLLTITSFLPSLLLLPSWWQNRHYQL